MPITWTFEPAQRLALLSVVDPYTIEEWRAAVLAILDAPVSREHVAILIDRRDAEPPTTKFVAEMTRFFAEHRGALSGARVAIVVSDDAAFGMGRMTELKSQLDIPDTTIRVFRSYDEAVSWLTTR
jgi:hypothetical protein